MDEICRNEDPATLRATQIVPDVTCACDGQNLVPLKGSEKQIRWAKEIRNKWVSIITCAEKDEEIIRCVSRIASAHWWIENRGLFLPDFVRRIRERIAREAFLEPVNDDLVGREVLSESLVTPVKITSPVVELGIDGTELHVFPPEYDESIIPLLKQYSFKWKKPFWVRLVDSESVVDRLVEIAVKLLGMGCPVRVFDEQIRSRIVAQEYEPEPVRQVEVSESAKYGSRLKLNWRLDVGNYKKIKRDASMLRGARVFDDCAFVSVSYFEEVEDFAQREGFVFTRGAQKAVEKKRLEFTGAARVTAKPKQVTPVGESEVAARLPATGEIDEELRDV